MLRACAGDESALEDIFRAHHGAIVCYLRRQPELGEADAAEVALDVFEEVARKGGFIGNGSVRAFLLTIAQRRARDVVRRHKAQKRQAPGPLVSIDEQRESDAGINDWEPPHDTPGPETLLALAQASREAVAFIEELPALERAAIMLVEVEGLSARDAGTILGCDEARVRKLAFQGRRRVAARLASRGHAVS